MWNPLWELVNVLTPVTSFIIILALPVTKASFTFQNAAASGLYRSWTELVKVDRMQNDADMAFVVSLRIDVI